LPLAIRNLETVVDNAAGTERSIKGNDETMASLQAEQWNFASQSADNLALYRKAIEANNTSLIEAFLHAKARVETAVDKVAPPLCEASRAGNLSLVNDMLQDAKDLPAALLNRCLADAVYLARQSRVQCRSTRMCFFRAGRRAERGGDPFHLRRIRFGQKA
jgi:hypothetical protein